MAVNSTATKPKQHNVNAVTNNGDVTDNYNSKCTSRRRLIRTKTDLRRDNLTAGIFLRWNLRYLLFLPLLYISGFIMCIGPFSSFLFQPYVPGAVYKSHHFFLKLWPDILSDNSTSLQLNSVWKYKRRLKVQRPCPNSTAASRPSFPANDVSAGSSGYLIVEANGGLNQQRSAICNAVALAGLLNAVLVIPHFELNNIWKDPSEFGDIYDENYFISTLEGYVKVIKELPDEVMQRFDHNLSNILTIRVQAWAPANYYLGVVYPMLQENRVIRIAPFANRLAMSVPPHIQLLRCIANYKALRFSSPISTLGQKLVNRMIEKSSRTGGKYVSIHLRFEEDMVAFSCCIYDGGDAEKLKMKSIREVEWKGKFKRTDRVIMPGLNRIEGKCPLTPLEVGMMLRGMGFNNNTAIYLASGKIYEAERHLAPLLQMFPLLYTKESLATPDELAPFEGYSSRLAALDYTVCLHSEVFVTTQGGNFPHFLMGQRRFLFDGHDKTIKPDKRKLVLLLQDMEISWEAFKAQMEMMLMESDRKGLMVPRVKKINRKTSIYTYPLPECGCLVSHNSSIKLSGTTTMPDSLLEPIR